MAAATRRAVGRPPPVLRTTEVRPGQGAPTSTVWPIGSGQGFGLTVAMQAMDSLDQLQQVEGWDRSARFGSSPTRRGFASCRTRPTPPPCSSTTGDRRRAYEADPRSFLDAWPDRARRTRHGHAVRGRERVQPRDAGRRQARADRREPVLLDDRDDSLAGGHGRDRRGARGAVDPARAVLRRARARPAGALGGSICRCSRRPTRRSSSGRRSAPSRRASGWWPRSRRSRGRTRRATARTSTSASGTTAGGANRFHDGGRALRALGDGRTVRGRDPRPHARSARA